MQLTFGTSESKGKLILAFFTGAVVLISGLKFLAEFVNKKIRYGAFLSLTLFTEIFLA